MIITSRINMQIHKFHLMNLMMHELSYYRQFWGCNEKRIYITVTVNFP